MENSEVWECTLVLLKPDAVKRSLCGEIIRRLENKNLQIVAMKMLKLTPEQAEAHYEEHKKKKFFPELLAYIMSGPVVAMVIGGVQAVKATRTLVGSTNPLEAFPGTIRGDLAADVRQNLVHASDSSESAQREMKIYFLSAEMHLN